MSINFIGGLNSYDQADNLVARSHEVQQNGYVQKFPVESPNLKNIDFESRGFRKRLGSVLESDLSSVAVAGEVLLRGIEWQDPTDIESKIQVVVGKKSIYTKQSSSWAQINDSSPAAYTHDADVNKVSFAVADGHLFIGLDGANKIQVYRSGANLDDPMFNGNTYTDAFGSDTHVMTGTWPTGCYLLTAIETRLVFSKGDTLFEFTPMAFTSSSGIWDLAGYGYGFYQASGKIRSITAFVPKYSDSLKANLYIGTNRGMEVATGVGSFQTQVSQDDVAQIQDTLVRIEGSQAPLNHQSFCATKNWLAYLTEDKNIYFINGAEVVDVGRRAKKGIKGIKGDSLDGLDMSSTNRVNNLTYSFAFYNPVKEQAMFFFTSDDPVKTGINDRCIVVDCSLGEPVSNEPQDSFEKRVRLLRWEIGGASTTAHWLFGVFQVEGKILGIKGDTYASPTGVESLYELAPDESIFNDYQTSVTTDPADGEAVEAYWYSPVFVAGGEFMSKQWLSLHFRGVVAGNFPVVIDVFTDRDTTRAFQFSFTGIGDSASWDEGTWDESVWGAEKTLAGNNDVNRYSEAIQWSLSNENTAQTFILTSQSVDYLLGETES